MKLRLIMPLLIIVAAFLFAGEVAGQTNASFGTIDVRTRETFRGPFYNYDTIFFKPLSVNIPWQSAGDSLGWILTTSKGAAPKLCRVSINTLYDSLFSIPFSETATNYSLLSGSEGVAFTDLSTNDTLDVGSAVGRDGDIIFVSRTDQGHDTLVITGTPTFYYNETGYPTFYLGGSAAGCIIQSDGISWYVTGVFYETAWERDYVDGFIFMKNPNDSLFVNGPAMFDSTVFVEDKFQAEHDNTYIGYNLVNENVFPHYVSMASGGEYLADSAAFVGVSYSDNFCNVLARVKSYASWAELALLADSSNIGNSISLQCEDKNINQSGFFIYPRNININTDSLNIYADSTFFWSDILYYDTYWDDITFPASQIKLGATAKPDYDFDELSLLFPYSDSTELIVANVQTPHRWSIGSDIYVHVHWIQSGANDTAEFILKYRWTDMGETQSASFTRIETTVCTYYNYVSGDLHQLAIFPAISGAGHTESSILDFKLFRKEDVGLNGDIEVKDFDIHYEINKPGSDNQTP